MREIFGPPLRAAAVCAFILGLILLVLNPPSLAGLGGLLAMVAGAVAIVLVTAWVTVALIGREMPERARFFVWRREGKAVAFAFCMVHDGTIHDLNMGLDYSVALRVVVPSVVLIVIGAQTIFSSFFLSFLGLRDRHARR